MPMRPEVHGFRKFAVLSSARGIPTVVVGGDEATLIPPERRVDDHLVSSRHYASQYVEHDNNNKTLFGPMSLG